MNHSIQTKAALRELSPDASDVMHARPARAWLLLPVGVGVSAAMAFGWSTREEYFIVPDEGLGYWLGPIGLGMMLLLLLYSLRKRWKPLRSAGPIQRWFHVHMAMGLLGPTAILFHSNFHLGSLNANVALACMLVVSGSGVVGRFIYTRIHYEFRGHVATFAELRSEAEREASVVVAAERVAPEMRAVLSAFEQRAMGADGGWAARAWSFYALGHKARSTRRRAVRAYRTALPSAPGAAPSVPQVVRAVKEHVAAVRRVGEFRGYERAFALWHALHLPFCVVLFAAAAVHVVAVHMY